MIEIYTDSYIKETADIFKDPSSHIEYLNMSEYFENVIDPYRELAYNCVNETFEKFNIDIAKYPRYVEYMAEKFNKQDIKQGCIVDIKDINIYRIYYVDQMPYIVVTIIKIDDKKCVINVYVNIDKLNQCENYGTVEGEMAA